MLAYLEPAWKKGLDGVMPAKCKRVLEKNGRNEMPLSFTYEPYIGPRPLLFGMTSAEVNSILGEPYGVRDNADGGFRAFHEKGVRAVITATYDSNGRLDEVEFGPGFELWFQGHDLLAEHKLITFLTSLDPNPNVKVGICVFFELGISTDADDDEADDEEESNRLINCFAKGCFAHRKAAK